MDGAHYRKRAKEVRAEAERVMSSGGASNVLARMWISARHDDVPSLTG
jgi:hypothetical protein